MTSAFKQSQGVEAEGMRRLRPYLDEIAPGHWWEIAGGPVAAALQPVWGRLVPIDVLKAEISGIRHRVLPERAAA